MNARGEGPLEAIMQEARRCGFDPGWYHRGKGLRVLLNRGKNTWEDIADEGEAAEWLAERLAEARLGKVFP